MKPQGKLTQFPIGSIRELLAISFPLMLSISSGAIMIFFDRFFLSFLSQEAFSASSEAASFFIVFSSSLISLVSSSEVLVGHLYGSGEHTSVSKPCWAMFWFSLFSFFIFSPIAQWAGPLFFKNSCFPNLSTQFFRSLTYFTPVFGINMALASFWIGRGKTVFITCVTIGVNILNIILDPILIFGKYGMPAFGISGAGIATGISQIIQSIICLIVLFKKENRVYFCSNSWKIDWKIGKACLFLGLPLMLSTFCQNCAWSTIAHLMSLSGAEYLLVWSVIHTAFALLFFIGDAVGKAAMAIISNSIGAKNEYVIPSILRSGVSIHLFFFSLIFTLFILFSEQVLSLFIQNYTLFSQSTQKVLYNAMWWNILLAFSEAILFLWNGALISLGDSRFVGVTGSILIWLFAVIPASVQLYIGASGDKVIAVTIWYYIAISFLYMYRFKKILKRNFN